MTNPIIDESFEKWAYNRISFIEEIDSKKWAHSLAYTGGVDPNDTLLYNEKIAWMIKGSPYISFDMRRELYLIAERVEVKYMLKMVNGKSTVIYPKTYKKMGIVLIHQLRAEYNTATVIQ